MFRRSLLAVFVGLLLAPPGTQAVDSKNSRPLAARPVLPGVRYYLVHRPGYQRVDYRAPAWLVLPAQDKATASQIAKTYRSNGWSARVTEPSKGQFVVKAQLKQWRLATYTINGRVAENVATMLRMQGYQARVR